MKARWITIAISSLGLMFAASSSQAGVIFTFQDDGGDVTMTTSGSLDVSGLVANPTTGWSGTGVGTFSLGGSARDMIGSTAAGAIDSTYIFNAGTDTSAWDGGSFVGGANFFGFTDSGTTPFATFAEVGGTWVSGIGIRASDLIGSMWTPDSTWTAMGTSIAAIGLIEGIYSITDARSGESLTIAINRSVVAVPAPQALMLLGMGLAALGLGRRRRNGQ